MAERQTHQQPDHSFRVQAYSPLIGVPVENDGHEEVAYFVTEEDAEHAVAQQRQPALKLAGVWQDLDAAAMLDGLDRIRHESKPTPPITAI